MSKTEQYNFYCMPKELFTNKEYRNISSDAKILYTVMLDRVKLSEKNNWRDANGKVYIYFTIENAMELLDCSHGKAVKLFSELDIKQGSGLIERKKQGQGKPAKIYVKSFSDKLNKDLVDNKNFLDKNSSENYEDSEVCMQHDLIDNSCFKDQTSKSNILELPKIRSQDFQKAECINTDINNNIGINLSNQSIKLYCSEVHTNKTSDIDEINTYEQQIKKNIDYDILIYNKPYIKEDVDTLVDLMLETVCSNCDTIRIGKQNLPHDLVKSRMLKINSMHIEYVRECLNHTTKKIYNIRSYMLTTLFNAPITMNQYYLSMVNYDIERGFFALSNSYESMELG